MGSGSLSGAKTPSPQSLLAVLKHPLRVRILEVVNHMKMSPSEFVERKLIPEEYFNTYQQALSLASYHFRELEKAGLAEIVEALPARGALEHVYSGAHAILKKGGGQDQLGALGGRRYMSTVSFLGLAARADTSLRSGLFDERSDRLLQWSPARLDTEGWTDLRVVLADAFARGDVIAKEAAERLNSSSRNPISVTFAVMGFESSGEIDSLAEDAKEVVPPSP